MPGSQAKARVLRDLLGDVARFSQYLGGMTLRSYQRSAARAIIDSVKARQGLSIVVMFPRQSGKNALQAQLESYLMVCMREAGAEMVKVSPTYQPQSLNAMRRIESALQANLVTRDRWRKRAGNIYQFGNASLVFLSGAPESHIVGATASLLLEVDEAQDVGIEKYDKEIAPMAASSNATRVFWGTAWTSQTLLARELRSAQAAQDADGIQRVFRSSAEEVGAEVPAYRQFVAQQVARMGRMHPLVRTQFFSEEIDAEGGLFDPRRIHLMQGSHPILLRPAAGAVYALLIDLAGEDEARRDDDLASLAHPGRDATAITIVEVDLGGVSDALVGRPLYRVVSRCLWTGVKQAAQYRGICALAEHWDVRYLVVDASGVGAGLASFLRDRLGERVLSVVFNAAVKSRIGWGFLAIVDGGRFKEYACEERQVPDEAMTLQALFFRQLEQVQYSVQNGPEKHVKWGVPSQARDHLDGSPLHDDLVLSAALCAVLDEQNWCQWEAGVVLNGRDPLIEMDKGEKDELFHV